MMKICSCNGVAGKKLGSVELLNSDDKYKAYGAETKLKAHDVGVSVIHFDYEGNEESNRVIPIVGHGNAMIKRKWDSIIELANVYQFAEQAGFAGQFKNWPRSRYPKDQATLLKQNKQTTGYAFVENIVLSIGVRMPLDEITNPTGDNSDQNSSQSVLVPEFKSESLPWLAKDTAPPMPSNAQWKAMK